MDLPVIYIAGSGRCGSTLLERVLGEIPGYVNVGELIQLALQTAPENKRCGCGQSFADCPFWTAVGKQAFGGWDNQHLATMRELHDRVTRQRYRRRVPPMELLSPDDLAVLQRFYQRLLQAVATESGEACVVDSSKDIWQALMLADAGTDLRVIHLMRDVRGVAFSMSRRHAGSTDPRHRIDMEWRTSAALAAVMWTDMMSKEDLLRRRGLPVARMRYEDFVRQPREVIERALGELGLPVGPADLAHIRDRRVTLPLSHGLSGNPSRVRAGELELRPDDAWRREMPWPDRLVATLIGLRYLRRYY